MTYEPVKLEGTKILITGATGMVSRPLVAEYGGQKLPIVDDFATHSCACIRVALFAKVATRVADWLGFIAELVEVAQCTCRRNFELVHNWSN
jgi:hypothetical protein